MNYTKSCNLLKFKDFYTTYLKTQNDATKKVPLKAKKREERR